jgi:hypothetical protein
MHNGGKPNEMAAKHSFFEMLIRDFSLALAASGSARPLAPLGGDQAAEFVQLLGDGNRSEGPAISG